MKKSTLLATALCLTGAVANAQGAAPAMQMDPAGITQDTMAVSSSGDVIIPLILIALLILALGTTGGSSVSCLSSSFCE